MQELTCYQDFMDIISARKPDLKQSAHDRLLLCWEAAQ